MNNLYSLKKKKNNNIKRLRNTFNEKLITFSELSQMINQAFYLSKCDSLDEMSE